MYRPDLDFQVFSVRGLWGKKGCFLQPAGRRSRPMRTLGPCSGALQAVFPPCLADCGLPRNRISSAMTPGEYDPDRISSAMAAVAGKKKAFFWFFWPPGGKKKKPKTKKPPQQKRRTPTPDLSRGVRGIGIRPLRRAHPFRALRHWLFPHARDARRQRQPLADQ